MIPCRGMGAIQRFKKGGIPKKDEPPKKPSPPRLARELKKYKPRVPPTEFT